MWLQSHVVCVFVFVCVMSVNLFISFSPFGVLCFMLFE